LFLKFLCLELLSRRSCLQCPPPILALFSEQRAINHQH
jgi:hypothetical protein